VQRAKGVALVRVRLAPDWTSAQWLAAPRERPILVGY
jgi:hypothetical protein